MNHGLPLLSSTPPEWAETVGDRLPELVADHAFCEQQAALTALNLVAHYPDDPELVERMTSLAAEEAVHLRRVAALLRRRKWPLARRRGNPYVQGLRQSLKGVQEPELKLDRLLVGALIEARSCERFTCLHLALVDRDPELSELLQELGPAERRHWEMFHSLAARGIEPERFDRRWRRWLALEKQLNDAGGREPRVHG